MSNLFMQILLGFLLGVCGAALKAVLMERYFLKGNDILSVLVFVGRLIIDVVVLFAMHYWIPALIASAFGLCTDQVYFLLKLRRKRGD